MTVSAPADLAEVRLLRALRGGQPGAFPTLWNAQAGAIWSVIRALCSTDVEAIGWSTTFRVDLGERALEFGTGDTVASQVGLALYAHLKPGFAEEAPLPPAPIPATEEGARRIPQAARLLYLVDLFFDVPVAPLERLAGKGARRTLDAVHRLLEPTDDTDARLYVHAALMRPAPIDVLILPPGAEEEPPKRWWIAGVAGAVVLLAASVPFALPWFERPDLAELAVRHEAALEDAPLRGDDPAALGLELSRRGVPSRLADVPNLADLGMSLLGARIVPGAESAIVLTYQGGADLWTLQHLLVAPAIEGPAVAALTTPEGTLEAWSSTGATLVPWPEGDGTWVLSADAPPDRVLAQAARIRTIRATISIPFLGDPPGAPSTRAPD